MEIFYSIIFGSIICFTIFALPNELINTNNMTIKGATIGDRFKTGKHTTAIVCDFVEKKSLTTGEVVGYLCIAKSEGLASNEFEVPFTTVLRNKIIQ